MAAERNFFHRWRGMTTIGYELGVIWEMSVKIRSRLGFEAGPLDAALARAIAWLSESGLLEARRQGKQPALTLTDRARKQQLGITNPS